MRKLILFLEADCCSQQECAGRARAGRGHGAGWGGEGGHCTSPEQVVRGNQGADARGDSASVLRIRLDLLYERGGWSVM